MNDQGVQRKIFLAISGICLVAFLFPWWSKRSTIIGPLVAEQEVFSFGIPGSPWFERVKEKKVEPGNVTFSNGQEYSPVCLSSASGVVGVILLIVAWRLRPAAQRPAG